MPLTEPLQQERYAAVLDAVPVGVDNAATYDEIAENVLAAGSESRTSWRTTR